jgi:uncharacterized membrane protein YuzA (DUF378 family)
VKTFDVIAAVLANLVYILVGLAAVYQAAAYRAIQRRWKVVPAAHA